MSRAVAIGSDVRLAGYALAGVEVIDAADAGTVTRLLEGLETDVGLVILDKDPDAARARGAEATAGDGVVLVADVSFAPLRDSLLADAQSRAASVQAEAAARVESELALARAEADALVARARSEAQQRAELDLRRRSASQRRDAQTRILRARREAYESLREEAIAAALSLRGEAGYEALLDRLEADARACLGSGATIERDPAGAGGVIARDRQRLIDATLPTLVERVLEELGTEVEALWA